MHKRLLSQRNLLALQMRDSGRQLGGLLFAALLFRSQRAPCLHDIVFRGAQLDFEALLRRQKPRHLLVSSRSGVAQASGSKQVHGVRQARLFRLQSAHLERKSACLSVSRRLSLDKSRLSLSPGGVAFRRLPCSAPAPVSSRLRASAARPIYPYSCRAAY